MDFPGALFQTGTPNLLVISGEHCGRNWGQICPSIQHIILRQDGQTEVVNKSLGNLLRILVIEHHSQWDQILPQAEFAYNDSPNRSTGKSPFQIVYGMHPRGISELRYLGYNEFRSAGAEDFLQRCKNFMTRSRSSCRTTTRSTKTELISIGDRFNLKWRSGFSTLEKGKVPKGNI
jgi:hypothetical protein